MGYDPTDTARAAEKMHADILVLESNEEAAAWDGFMCALAVPCGHEDAEPYIAAKEIPSMGTIADAFIRERRRRTGRLVAGRVGEERELDPLRVLLDAVENWYAHGSLGNPPKPANEALAAAWMHYRDAPKAANPAPSALTPEQEAVIEKARVWHKWGGGLHDPATSATNDLRLAVDDLNAAEGRPQS